MAGWWSDSTPIGRCKDRQFIITLSLSSFVFLRHIWDTYCICLRTCEGRFSFNSRSVSHNLYNRTACVVSSRVVRCVCVHIDRGKMWTAAAASRGRPESWTGLNFSHCRCTAGGLAEKDGETLAVPQAHTGPGWEGRWQTSVWNACLCDCSNFMSTELSASSG